MSKKVPLYENLRRDVIEKIRKNIWKNGDQLPTDMEFCDLYGVSRITVRRALQELENSGYIYRIQGKGSFVKYSEIKQDIGSFYSFSEELIKKGYIPSSIFIDFLELPADELVSKNLNVEIGEKVYLLERLRLANDMIIAYDRSYFPVAIFPNFQKTYIVEGSLYKAFENFFSIIPEFAEETIEAITVNEHDAKRMHQKSGSPNLLIQRVAWADGRRVEFNYRIVNSTFYKYKTVLIKKNKE